MKLGCGYPWDRLLARFRWPPTQPGTITHVMYDEFKERRFASPPLLKRLVMAGWYGRKTGKGFTIIPIRTIRNRTSCKKGSKAMEKTISSRMKPAQTLIVANVCKFPRGGRYRAPAPQVGRFPRVQMSPVIFRRGISQNSLSVPRSLPLIVRGSSVFRHVRLRNFRIPRETDLSSLFSYSSGRLRR